jgi:hypothetical protein
MRPRSFFNSEVFPLSVLGEWTTLPTGSSQTAISRRLTELKRYVFLNYGTMECFKN